MADANLNAALRPYAHPQASPGFGKRTVSDQRPRRKGDFAELPVREAYLAAFIDGLSDGSAIDVKTLARAQPLYGQQAVAAALRALSAAGFLRRFKENVGADGGMRWVWRTYFSRTARDGAWWARFAADGVVADAAPAAPAEPEGPVTVVPAPDRTLPAATEPVVARAPAPAARPVRSEAYDLLASLGRADSRLVLSANECAALESDAAAWLGRGADRAGIVRALTAGLPLEVHSAGGLVRRRLRDKLPPELPAAPAPAPAGHADAAGTGARACTRCGKRGGAPSVTDGLCQECRSLPPEDVRNHVRMLRDLCASVGRATGLPR